MWHNMEFKELKKKSEKDLYRILAEYRDKLRDLRFKDANKQLKDVRQIRKIRIIISQILTLLNKKKTVNSKQTAAPSASSEQVSKQSASIDRAKDDI